MPSASANNENAALHTALARLGCYCCERTSCVCQTCAAWDLSSWTPCSISGGAGAAPLHGILNWRRLAAQGLKGTGAGRSACDMRCPRSTVTQVRRQRSMHKQIQGFSCRFDQRLTFYMLLFKSVKCAKHLLLRQDHESVLFQDDMQQRCFLRLQQGWMWQSVRSCSMGRLAQLQRRLMHDDCSARQISDHASQSCPMKLSCLSTFSIRDPVHMPMSEYYCYSNLSHYFDGLGGTASVCERCCRSWHTASRTGRPGLPPAR